MTTNMHEYQNFSENVENVESPQFLKKSLLAHDIQYMLKLLLIETFIHSQHLPYLKTS